MSGKPSFHTFNMVKYADPKTNDVGEDAFVFRDMPVDDTSEEMGIQPTPFADASDKMGIQPTPFADASERMGVEPTPFDEASQRFGVEPTPFEFDLF